MSGSTPQPGSDPTPTSPTPPPAPAPAARPRRTVSAYRWQVAIAAAIAAVATVGAALITTLIGGGDGEPSAGREPGVSTSATNTIQPTVTFTSWSEKPTDPPGREYEFEGRVSDLPANYTVHVIIEIPTYGPSPLDSSPQEPVGSEWLVSPAADVLRDGHWKLTWAIAHPPAGGKWVVVVFGDCPTCTAAPATIGGLKANGPRDPHVAAAATAPLDSSK